MELSAGKLDGGENLLSCVKRELREETGYSARRITKLMSYWPTPAFASEVLHIFVAEGLSGHGASPDEDEFLEVAVMPFHQPAVEIAICTSGPLFSYHLLA